MPRCTHLDTIEVTEPPPVRGPHLCGDCLALGDGWVHLRMCLACGYIGCCDASKNRHATAHARESGHPLVRSIEPGESWRWCYVDEVMLPT